MKKKSIVFLFLFAAGMLLPASLSAQEHNSRPGGLFGGSSSSYSNGLMEKSRNSLYGDVNGQSFGENNGNITGQTFGAPLGSGLFVLLAAGAGYSVLKRKKQNK